jgi:hypothetical protein
MAVCIAPHHTPYFFVSASLFKYIKAASRPGLMRGGFFVLRASKMEGWK